MTRLIIVLLALLLMIGTPAVDAAPPPTPDEVQIGRQIALQLETRYKVLNDAALTERMNRIAEAVVAVADRPGVTYVFKVLDVDVANALSLPGGFVYITKPMFEFVRSDHELAAIIAHEVAHIAHVHGMEMLRRQSQATLITILIAALTRDPAVAQGVQLASLSALAHYTRDLERDADLAALAYLQKTAYAPVGLLTVMERFAWEEQYRAVTYQGVADHPKTAERVVYIEQELRRRGLPIVRRVAANYLRLTVREVKERGVAGGELLVNDRVIFRLPNLDRVREAAERLDRLFNADLRSFEVGVRSHGETWVLVARGATLVTVTAQDAAWNEKTVKELAMTVHARLRAAMEEDLRRRKLSG